MLVATSLKDIADSGKKLQMLNQVQHDKQVAESPLPKA
jgi:hypothetical protein